MGKAYIVSADDRAEVVFADTANQARAWGGGNLDGSEYIDRRARRAPEFDGREDNPPTMRELVEQHGWWAECRCCNRSVLCDTEGAKWSDDSTVTCSPECAEAAKVRDAKARQC